MKSRVMMLVMMLGVLAGATGVATAQDYRYNDRDGYRYYDRDGDRDYGFRYARRAAWQTGFNDGASVAREDMWRGKPFNPNPRGRFDDCDHGYSRDFGSKHEYREQYARAYREGYQRTFQQRGWYR